VSSEAEKIRLSQIRRSPKLLITLIFPTMQFIFRHFLPKNRMSSPKTI